MTEAPSFNTAGMTPEAVGLALVAPGMREALMRHALARLGVLLADRATAVRADAAAEAVQETSRRALAGAHTFDPSRADPAAWLHGILNWVLHEHCRALRKQPLQPCADPAAWEELEARTSAPDGTPALHAMLTGLSDDQREIVVMHHLDGLSHEQIADLLGISVGNSRVKLARAMAKLKQLAAWEDVR